MLPRRTDFASPPCLGNANHYFSKSRRPAARRTTKPRPTWPWLSAGRTCPIHTRALLFTRRVSVVLLFVCFRRSFFFLTYFFWLIVAFRFRMQLRPRPRRGSPLGGISRRGSVSAVTFLYAVRRRRLTRLIFDRGGGITTTRKRRIFKMLLVRAGKNVVVGGPGRHAGRRGAGHHAGQCCVPPVRRRF